MSSFAVNGVNYNSMYLRTYLGMVPANETMLKKTFNEFDVSQTGDIKKDLKKLDSAMYERYSEQVQTQIANQNNEQVVPWASLCAQIGVQATGDYQTDLAAFNNAINLLSQSAGDGQAMAYFAGLRSEANNAFGLSNIPDALTTMSYQNYQAQFLY